MQPAICQRLVSGLCKGLLQLSDEKTNNPPAARREIHLLRLLKRGLKPGKRGSVRGEAWRGPSLITGGRTAARGHCPAVPWKVKYKSF